MFRRPLRTTWPLCFVALLASGAPSSALGQEGAQAEAPRKATSPPPRKVTPIEIIGSYRPVDPSRPENPQRPSPAAQTGLDLYLNAGADAPLRVGQVFEVFRTITPADHTELRLTIKVGTVEILSIQGPLAIGRAVGGPSADARPHLRTPGILIGDFVRPNAPLTDPDAKDATRDTPKATADAKPTRRRPKHRRKPKITDTPPPEPCPKPAEEGLLTDSTLAPPTLPREGPPPDSDTYESWRVEPINF